MLPSERKIVHLALAETGRSCSTESEGEEPERRVVVSPAKLTVAAETIAAIATPPGRGAIAIVRASGPRVRGVSAA